MWKIEFKKEALKKLLTLDKVIQKRILKFLDERISKHNSPCLKGNALVGNKAGLWRYRVGDYRIICQINEKELIVLVINVGHQKDIYKD